jgi:hypothetical protein
MVRRRYIGRRDGTGRGVRGQKRRARRTARRTSRRTTARRKK